MLNYKEFRREMRARKWRIYWQYKARQVLNVLLFITSAILVLATTYGFMLALPD
jgi:hypothetical protein